jgi:hypothetical protein
VVVRASRVASVRVMPWKGAVPRSARGPTVRQARRGAASAGPTLCHCTPAWTPKTPKIRIEVHKVVNRKVVDLTILYSFYKGSRVFFSTDFALSAVKL